MSAPSYPAARAVAERIEQRLRHVDVIPKPDTSAIEEIISAAFWASLRREEGRPPRISLVLVPPDQVLHPLIFESPLPLIPEILARLAPAVERPGIHLGVWWVEGRLCVWGSARVVPVWCFVLEVVAPGLLVVKYRRPEPSTKFANVAVLEGAQVKFIHQQGPSFVNIPPPLQSLLAFYSSAGEDESDHVLVRLAISMRDHGRGGSLLVVPEQTETWRHSIVHPVTYSVSPAYSYNEAPGDLLRLAIEALAGATAVDGATLISDRFSLLAFGAKIIPRPGATRVDRVLLNEPIEDSIELVVEPSHLGGTRHLSAAQFIQDQPDAIALVASQDGRFTVFAWSQSREMVYACRFESLLL